MLHENSHQAHTSPAELIFEPPARRFYRSKSAISSRSRIVGSNLTQPTWLALKATTTNTTRTTFICLRVLICAQFLLLGTATKVHHQLSPKATDFQSCSSATSPKQNCDLLKDKPNFEVVELLVRTLPTHENQHEVRPQPLKAGSIKCTDKLELSFQTQLGDDYSILLVKNRLLIGDRYFQNQQLSKQHNPSNPPTAGRHTFIDLQHSPTNDVNDEHCHYHGQVNGDTNSIAAISLVHNERLATGFFQYDGQSYYLHANFTLGETILSWRSPNLCPADSSEASSGANQPNKRLRRSPAPPSTEHNHVKYNPFQSNSSSLYVELLVVHDHSQYLEYGKDAGTITERTLQIVNIMNAFYRQLNIFVALVGVVLWTEKDEIKLTVDGDTTLTNFLKYRYEKLLPQYFHDNAQLITNSSFNGSVVGKALRDPICTHEHSGGVSTDHNNSPAVVAVTLAHELGHNLGMEHDEDDKCQCPDEKCIMSASSSDLHPKHWSSCSVDYLNESRRQGLLECLTNAPSKIFGPSCGNGFVEEGEDCDLGELLPVYKSSKSTKRTQKHSNCTGGLDCLAAPPGPDTNSALANPCCDRFTCKFTSPNVTCAQGPCCDLSTCQIFKGEPGMPARVCRPRDSECDLEEVCDGQSEHCPPDVHYHDGIECGPLATISAPDAQVPLANSGASPPLAPVHSLAYNRSRSYCFAGRCASHESQCRLLWGPTGSSSPGICFQQNAYGNTSGHCGYDALRKTYLGCEPENNLCGMLHCAHAQPPPPANGSSTPSPAPSDIVSKNGDVIKRTGKLAYGSQSASVLTFSYITQNNQARHFCHGAIIDAGPGRRDPGLAPNGASCGDERMCVNQKCLHLEEVLADEHQCSPIDCNGNGICDNLGRCHCYDGSVGANCYQYFGLLALTFYTLMFVVPILGLIWVAGSRYRQQLKLWWFVHNKKQELAKKARRESAAAPLTLGGGGGGGLRSCAQQPPPGATLLTGGGLVVGPFAAGAHAHIPLNQRQRQTSPLNEAGAGSSSYLYDPWAETDPSAATAPTASPRAKAGPNLPNDININTNINKNSSTAGATVVNELLNGSRTPGFRLEPLRPATTAPSNPPPAAPVRPAPPPPPPPPPAPGR